MGNKIAVYYDRIVLKHPLLTILLVLFLVIGVGFFTKNFRLDASADSLLLENDQDLKYFRSINANYGSADYLVVSYSPKGDLYSAETLDDLRKLRDSLLQIERVDTVLSILDVPLIDSPRLTLGDLNDGIRTLETPGIDTNLVRKEFQTSPFYKELLVSSDAKTTALQVIFKRDKTFHSLLQKRNSLREKKLAQPLTATETAKLEQASQKFDEYTRVVADQEAEDIAKIRSILTQHQNQAEIFLGGVPMIVTDMISFIRHDLAAFGFGVLIFLVAMLFLIFRRPSWIILPMVCCFASVFFMFGFLGLVGWKVTVVSSNFTSLLLIITLSLCVHLIVRYNELYEEMPGADHFTMVKEMVRSKAIPSIYTSLTTIVAFASLLTSDIRPVIDFGWMMAIGISFALLISFALFPAGLMLYKKPVHFTPRFDITGIITRTCAHWIESRSRLTLVIFASLTIISMIGISKLTVENRFIDYFKPTTEIYQGMELIDKKLGGTTPLDVIIDADPDFFATQKQEQADTEDDPFEDDFFADEQADAGLSGSSYWYNSYQIDTLENIHQYLDDLPETGKVLSMATTMMLMQQLNEDVPLDNLSLAVIHKKLPAIINDSLFRPYMSADGNQVRFSLRVIDSNPDLHRNDLLKKIRLDLTEKLNIKPEQIHLTGMFVLYNNVLQSLFSSQIMTIGVVFLVIMMMFILQFRSIRLAIISIIPNLISAGMVLGLMGLLRIPLDIMTITIAAITIGIAVDDTIHYVHRFNEEILVDGNYLTAMKRCHDSVGRAMYYTSVTIIIGFSILTLSNFLPTIYFGLFTGLAMFIAMLANLTLLPLLLITWKPRTGE
ncbi:MMPL family transporter [uncultured Desulfuromusa sp.]|uniref:efflux RND transporter permease subunit n=1 Tax=uncultured Desulfuromusa sp. TaxID=219183 RepID=UPI002AA8E9B0|nr:MMPL family transporter [uncultured Desulfuromusa sp.]